jgi:hypothetical protein
VFYVVLEKLGFRKVPVIATSPAPQSA